MSTLWTPDGEIEVGRTASAAGSSDSRSDTVAPADPLDEAAMLDLENLSPEEREQAEKAIRELAETRARLLEVPAAMVVANHAMGLYELAALHLANQPPNFSEASLAIDAMGALLEGMAGRLGESEPTLQEGLTQIRMSFVKLKQTSGTNDDD